MKIKFLGASGSVTGSSHVLTSSTNQSILIDLGMFQGSADIDKYNYQPINHNLKSLKAAILSHAHLDHCGRIPLLIKAGFDGQIYMTPPTADLCTLSLLDSAKIAKEDKNQILYTTEDVLKTIKHFVTVDYNQPIHVGDFIINFKDAGHILGAASVEVTDKSVTNFSKIVFSGDIGNYPASLERHTEFIRQADIVVMETTYGDRLHPKENPVEVLKSEINAIETSGGTLLIPSFSLDRAQELLHMIMHLKKDGKILNETPVILDSPMAEKATRIYVEYPKLFNTHIQEDFKIGQLFDFPGLEVTNNWKDSQRLHQREEAKVIIAGAGMMSGGRIVNHAKFYLSNPTTRVMIVGYQSEGTLGRKLLQGDKEVIIDGVKIEIKASIRDTQAMSSHADQRQLLDWLKNINGVKKVFLTHGDDQSRKIFSELIKNELGINDITIPTKDQEISF